MDPRSLATGALVATLTAHRGDWVRRHADSLELLGGGDARRTVTVDFELPRIAWAMAADRAPVIVPLGVVPRASRDGVVVEDELGARVEVLSAERSEEIAAAGLLAFARAAGADGDELLGPVRRLAGGTPAEAEDALADLARGEARAARRAWMHDPFRRMARRLAGNALLLVALADADRPRTLTYSFGERLPVVAGSRTGGLYGGLARRLGWDGVELRAPLPHLDDARDHALDVDAGPAADASFDVDERTGGAAVRVTATRTREVELAPVVALVAAALLLAASVAAPTIAGRAALSSFALVLPAAVAAYLARRPEHPMAEHLLRGWRRLLLGVVALSLAGQVVLAAGASKAVVRPTAGVLAIAVLAVAALLLESRRRAAGRAAAQLAPAVSRPPGVDDDGRFDATRIALLALLMGGGLMVVALGDAVARAGDGGARPLVWAGLLAIYVPAVVNAWRVAPRGEALAGVVLLGLALYLVKVLHSPLQFTFHDEFSTLRTTLDIERFGKLFEENPLIGVHPSYPALELATTAVASITGLSTFTSGLIVIGAVRVGLMAALFLVFESVSSTRVAALATVLYACNPNFLFFDSQWAYESFALPLALIVIAMAARGRRLALLSVPVLLVLCVSHPLTSIALVVFLLLWSGIDRWTSARAGDAPRRELWALALVGAVGTLVWVVVVARGLGGYLGPVLGKAGNSLVDLLLSESGPKRVFGAAGVGDTPLAERLFGFASVLLALAAIGFGTRPLWKRFTALGGALGVVALAYPFSLPLRLTEAGTEISNRASEFVFVGVALLGALALTRGLPRPRVPLVAALAATAMIGGVVVGTAPWARIPATYRVLADEASVEPEGLRAASWARAELGTGNRIFTDRINGLMMGSIGLQEPQLGLVNDVPIERLFTERTVNDVVRSLLAGDQIAYLVVDRRIATALPSVGFYFNHDEPGAYEYTRPLELGALVKYDAVCPIARVFDSGNLLVYDTRRMARDFGCVTEPGRAP